MLIKRKSMLTGLIHYWRIPVTMEQLDDWYSGTLIQDAMPNLSADQREFVVTGILPSEWKNVLGEETIH